jgi:hypothetical protein
VSPTRARRWALILTGVSLAAWGTWDLVRPLCHPYADLSCGLFSDHFSHMNTGRLFTYSGINIWLKPLKQNGRPLTPDELAALPSDLKSVPPDLMLAIPGWPKDKPFVSSWNVYPRFHPPGDMVVTAPVAVLYSLTSLSFSESNRLLILLFLVYAHLSIYVLFKSGVFVDRARPLGFLVLFLVYAECVHWALEGFYEPLVIAPLVLCGRYAYQKRGLAAFTAYSAAAFLHFRALFLLPLGLYSLYLMLEERESRDWKRRDYLTAAASIVMAGSSFAAFVMVWPYLKVLAVNNVVNVTGSLDVPALVTFAIVVVAVGALLVYARAWLDAGILLFLVVLLLLLRQTFGWDVLSLLAWLGIPIIAVEPDRVGIVRDARLVAVFFVAVFVFGNDLMPTWFTNVLA